MFWSNGSEACRGPKPQSSSLENIGFQGRNLLTYTGNTIWDVSVRHDAVFQPKFLASGVIISRRCVIGAESRESAVCNPSPHSVQIFRIMSKWRTTDTFRTLKWILLVALQSLAQQKQILRTSLSMDWQHSRLSFPYMLHGDLRTHVDNQDWGISEFCKTNDAIRSFVLSDLGSRYSVEVRVAMAGGLETGRDERDNVAVLGVDHRCES